MSECKFCEKHDGERFISKDFIDGTVKMFTEWDYGMLRIKATDGGVTAFYQPKYCPECGRKLYDS